MSMKLQAKLLYKLSSHVESKYTQMQDAIRLEGVKAEMTFKASQGFMEHESQKHEYLPCFHMIGQVLELRGQFPFNVSALYFSEADQQAMIRDIIYYPTPEELAHIIQTGQYYSKNFVIPPILASNTYTLPCVVDLTVVPPPNQAAYENNLFLNFMDLEEEEQVNLPIFYVGLNGTGVSRKNDRLLDYYGIDLEPGYDQFVLTAESSGYVDPPLLQYMTAPVVEEQVQAQAGEERYITPEEEAELLQSSAERQRQAEQEAQVQVSMDAEADFHEASPEDAIVAQANRDVERRLETRFGGRRMSLDALRQQQQQQERSENSAQTDEPEFLGEEKPTKPDTPQDMTGVRSTVVTNPETPAQQSQQRTDEKQQEAQQEEREFLEEDEQDVRMMEGGDVEDARAQTKVDEAHAKDIALDVAQQQQQTHLREEKKPEAPQESHGPETTVSPVEDKQAEKETAQEVHKDAIDLEHMAGADVSDVRAQSKVNEAQVRDAARDAARQQQEQVHREVPERLSDLAAQADQAGKGSEDPEFI